jgi:glycosyltransferase involved in cell wall biosynthesis
VTDRLRIVQLNLAYTAALATPQALLADYHTLTGWADATRRAGADVVTVQRFCTDADVAHRHGRVLFVADEGEPLPRPWDPCSRVCDSVRSLAPDVVHINGLVFPGAAMALRRRLPATVTIVLQDHSGIVSRAWPWPIGLVTGRRWAVALAAVDAVAFTDRALADRWRARGLAADATVLELPEAASALEPQPIADAVGATGMSASPAVLWVGRLDENKDPLTVLAALEMSLPRMRGAHCWMIYGDAPLEAAVRDRVTSSATLRGRVTLVGHVPHDRMGAWFSAADIFVSGSRHEGSGYSLIEAMACGVMPCVTNIPSFRALTGGHGVLWTAGDADACAAALVDLAGRDRETERQRILRRYADALSWDSIGRRTVAAYRDLVERRRGAAER